MRTYIRTFIEKNLPKAIAHYFSLDPESQQRLHQLHGKTVTIELLNIGWAFQLCFNNASIELKTQAFSSPDTVIKGTPLSLLHMVLSAKDTRKRFFADDITMEGDLELGQKIVDLFDELEIDYEEYLSHWVGDVSAHQIGRISRKITRFNKHLRESLTQNINEYAHEEINLFPPREALQDFFQDVDTLRMDTDRLEAKVTELIKSVHSKEEV